MVVGYSLLLLLLLVALITLAVLGYWLMYVAARWQLQCHVCHPPIPPRPSQSSGWFSDIGSRRIIGGNTKSVRWQGEAAKGDSEAGKWFLSEWMKLRLRRHGEHKWKATQLKWLRMIEWRESGWQGNRPVHYSTSSASPGECKPALNSLPVCISMHYCSHACTLCNPRLHSPLLLAPLPLLLLHCKTWWHCTKCHSNAIICETKTVQTSLSFASFVFVSSLSYNCWSENNSAAQQYCSLCGKEEAVKVLLISSVAMTSAKHLQTSEEENNLPGRQVDGNICAGKCKELNLTRRLRLKTQIMSTKGNVLPPCP